MNKKGFTLIELLAVIVILGIILLIATPIIFDIIEEVRKEAFIKSSEGIVSAAKLKYTSGILKDDFESATFTYVNGVEQSNPLGIKLGYSGKKPKSGAVTINNDGKIAIALYDGTYCTTKSFESSRVIMEELDELDCALPVSYVFFDADLGVNIPLISDGMTPIKWNGTAWVDTIEDDPEWYDYDTKKWANARTEDGSFWVWIPRYAYKITSGYHTSTAGEIDIKFLADDTIFNLDRVPVETSEYEVGVKDTSSNYFLHPAFTFGSEKLMGIWVAKFEASNSSNKIKIGPNLTSWRSLPINSMYILSYNMRNDAIYGWEEAGVDTHMMKDTEWGAVAYMSASQYGKDGEVWINPASNYTTGCAGTGPSVSQTASCYFPYQTANGMNASTTGNIHGVYDMSGGANEYVAAYVDNGSSSLTGNSNSLYNADPKYKDLYAVGTTDSVNENYIANSNYYGNGRYEITANGSSISAWNNDNSSFSYGIMPSTYRGGMYSNDIRAGIWDFRFSTGGASPLYTFRPTLIVTP